MREEIKLFNLNQLRLEANHFSETNYSHSKKPHETNREWLSSAKKTHRRGKQRAMAKRDAAILTAGMKVAGTSLGTLAGASLSTFAVQKLTKKLRSKISYLESLGIRINTEQKEELKRAKQKLIILRGLATTVGAVGGGAVGYYGTTSFLKKKKEAELKKMWDTDDDEDEE